MRYYYYYQYYETCNIYIPTWITVVNVLEDFIPNTLIYIVRASVKRILYLRQKFYTVYIYDVAFESFRSNKKGFIMSSSIIFPYWVNIS